MTALNVARTHDYKIGSIHPEYRVPVERTGSSYAVVETLARQQIQAVLWDLDGTLVDSEGSFQAQAFTQAMQIVHNITPPLNAFGIPHTVGKTPDEIFADMCLAANIPKQSWSIPQLMSVRQRLLKQVIRQGVRLMAGVKPLLTMLQRHGIKQAIASQSPQWQAELVAKHAGIASYFDLILGGDKVPRERRKPMPDLYQLAAQQLDVNPGQCLILEDTMIGATAGVRARCRTILIPTIYNQGVRSHFCPTLNNSLKNTSGLMHILQHQVYGN
ncbi:MAG: HAD family phosphatase [Chloroflexi bacterium]|nr:HAD family phosphatase [Chloroflexota bacterium]